MESESVNETDLCVDLCGPSIEMTDGGDHETDCVWADGGDRASVNDCAPSAQPPVPWCAAVVI